MADPDWTDPCAVAAWLRPQYYALVTGGAATRIVYAGRDTTYTGADADKLLALLRTKESECSAKNGTRIGRRRAFWAG
jgi:hypothetical protein